MNRRTAIITGIAAVAGISEIRAMTTATLPEVHAIANYPADERLLLTLHEALAACKAIVAIHSGENVYDSSHGVVYDAQGMLMPLTFFAAAVEAVVNGVETTVDTVTCTDGRIAEERLGIALREVCDACDAVLGADESAIALHAEGMRYTLRFFFDAVYCQLLPPFQLDAARLMRTSD